MNRKIALSLTLVGLFATNVALAIQASQPMLPRIA